MEACGPWRGTTLSRLFVGFFTQLSFEFVFEFVFELFFEFILELFFFQTSLTGAHAHEQTQ